MEESEEKKEIVTIGSSGIQVFHELCMMVCVR